MQKRTAAMIVFLLFLFFEFSKFGQSLAAKIKYSVGRTTFALAVEAVQKPKGKVLVSLTTSPKRLAQGILKTLQSLAGASKILLNVPLRFRNVEEYDMKAVEALQLAMGPVLEVHWLPQDYGPQTKLYGALVRPDIQDYDLLVVVDDDTEYKKDMLFKFEEQMSSLGPRSLLSGNVGILVMLGNFVTLHGYSGFALRPFDLDIPQFLSVAHRLSASHPSCKRHDDLVFSETFRRLGFKILEAREIEVLQLPMGFEPDALHQEELNFTKHIKCGQALLRS